MSKDLEFLIELVKNASLLIDDEFEVKAKDDKGDLVIGQDWLIEAKTCMQPKSSFSIKKQWLDKLREEQFATNKMYNALCFDYGDNKNRYYIIDENTFKQVIELLKDV